MVNSIQKGKRFEREVVRILRAHGFLGAQRAQQYKGTVDSCDVETGDDSVDNIFAIECKNRPSATVNNLYEYLDRQRRDAPGKVPLLAFKGKKKEMLAVLSWGDLCGILRDAFKPL
jgi:Holliday junction resolvase